MASNNDYYITVEPSDQNAIDIFSGQWTSHFPPPYESLHAGPLGLFEDPRVNWASEKLGGVRGKSILELGPLEGAHSYMLEKAGAKSVLAMEANVNAFLRCLVTKEILGLRKARFLCGDFRPYLSTTQTRFDVVFACGVLYHMMEPVQLLFDISQHTDNLFLWTHYFELNLVAQNNFVRDRFAPGEQLEFRGLKYEQHRFNYEAAVSAPTFCGGTAPFAAWLTRDSILGALSHFGFKTLHIDFDQPDHPNGPSFAVAASRD